MKWENSSLRVNSIVSSSPPPRDVWVRVDELVPLSTATETAIGVSLDPERRRTPEMLGSKCDRTRVAEKIEDRLKQNGGVDTFTRRFDVIGCLPDFDKAISTLAVRDIDGQSICVRKGTFYTLLDFTNHYCQHVRFDKLRAAWEEGPLLLRPST